MTRSKLLEATVDKKPRERPSDELAGLIEAHPTDVTATGNYDTGAVIVYVRGRAVLSFAREDWHRIQPTIHGAVREAFGTSLVPTT